LDRDARPNGHIKQFSFHGFSDVDWGGDLDDKRSVGSYCVFLGQNLIS